MNRLYFIVFLLSTILFQPQETIANSRMQIIRDHTMQIDFQAYVTDPILQDALRQTLSAIQTETENPSFIIVSNRQENKWNSFTILLRSGKNCRPDNAVSGTPHHCTYSILAHEQSSGNWILGLRGSEEYLELLRKAPDYYISKLAKAYLDPEQRSLQKTQTVTYKFPWVGTWDYWQGWHSDQSGGDALDIGTYGTDRRILAPAPGTILDVCQGANDHAWVKIQHDDGTILNYVHLLASTLEPNIEAMKRVTRGQVIGSLKPGTFSDSICDGYAIQTPTSAHLHWDFLTHLPSYTVDGWTIDLNLFDSCGSGGYWSNGSSTIKPCQSPYHTLTSTNSPTLSCCGCVGTLAYSQNSLPQPNFLEQFAAEGPTYTDLVDEQAQTTTSQPWPTLPLFTTTPTFVENEVSLAWTNEPTISVRWSLADRDELAGYQLFWDRSPRTAQAAEPLLLSAQATGAQIPVGETGEWYVHLQAVGEESSVSRTVHAGPFRVDLSPPMVAAPEIETIWQTEPQVGTVRWSPAVDAESGVAGYFVYWGADASGTSDHFTRNTEFTPDETLAADDAASRYLRVAPQDLAGNVGAWQTVAAWHYDGLAPTGALTVGGGSEVVYSLNTQLAVAGDDGHSGLAEMRFSPDGRNWSPWEPYQPNRFWQFDNQSEPQTIYAQLRDAAGNLSEPLVAEVAVILNVDQPSSTSYSVANSTLGTGGGQKTSASYALNGTSGQLTETGSASSDSYGVDSGYWQVACTAVSTAIPTIEATASNQIKLSWESVANATDYNIYRSSNPYFVPSTVYATSNGSPWFDDNIIGDGSSYYYLIRAVGGCGESGNSQRKGAFDFAIQPGGL